jgi:hypothetical protein
MITGRTQNDSLRNLEESRGIASLNGMESFGFASARVGPCRLIDSSEILLPQALRPRASAASASFLF